jgi:hypothetical protein
MYHGRWYRRRVRHCVTSRKVIGSSPIGVLNFFSIYPILPALGCTQPLTQMSTRRFFWASTACYGDRKKNQKKLSHITRIRNSIHIGQSFEIEDQKNQTCWQNLKEANFWNCKSREWRNRGRLWRGLMRPEQADTWPSSKTEVQWYDMMIQCSVIYEEFFVMMILNFQKNYVGNRPLGSHRRR